MQSLIHSDDPPERQIPFATARDNFYAAARHGLDAHVTWLGDQKGPVHALILEQLLPAARRGLEAIEIDPGDIDKYLGIFEGRVRNAQNGAAWQRAFVARHGTDMERLTEAYYRRQEQGNPVHEWDIDSAL
jgi:hypothetical protein